MKLGPIKLRSDVVLRVVADTVLLSGALAVAVVARFVVHTMVAPGTGYDATTVFRSYMASYASSVLFLTAACLITLAVAGVYTTCRALPKRQKLLVVARSVTVGYLLFGFGAYFFQVLPSLPRGSLVLSYVIGILLTGGTRVWSYAWLDFARRDRRRQKPEEHAIRRILVVGGAGYIGSAVVPMLLKKGYYVRVLDSLMYGPDAIAPFLKHPHFELIEGDFRDTNEVVKATEDMDAVVHLGAIVGDPACELCKGTTLEVNLMATRMIAEVAKGANVGRFVFASTCSVYGCRDDILDEQSPLGPVSLYAQSKAASEKVVLDMSDADFAPTILRFGTIYGLSGRVRFDLVVNLLSAKACLEKEVPIMGGDNWRPFLHVEDAARAVVTVLESPLERVRTQIFNVGSDDQNLTIRQLGGVIQRLVPETRLVEHAADGDRRNYRVSFRKITDSLNYRTSWTVEAGVKQMLAELTSGTILDYKEHRYSNVKHLGAEHAAPVLKMQTSWADAAIVAVTPGPEAAIGVAK